MLLGIGLAMHEDIKWLWHLGRLVVEVDGTSSGEVRVREHQGSVVGESIDLSRDQAFWVPAGEYVIEYFKSAGIFAAEPDAAVSVKVRRWSAKVVRLPKGLARRTVLVLDRRPGQTRDSTGPLSLVATASGEGYLWLFSRARSSTGSFGTLKPLVPNESAVDPISLHPGVPADIPPEGADYHFSLEAEVSVEEIFGVLTSRPDSSAAMICLFSAFPELDAKLDVHQGDVCPHAKLRLGA